MLQYRSPTKMARALFMDTSQSWWQNVASSSRKKVSHPKPHVETMGNMTCFAATEIEGIYRLSGSEKRIKDLQTIFNSPERYGKGLDWTGYTVHDAANILRRYLNQLPEPIVPLDFYDPFRDPIRSHQAQAVGGFDLQGREVGDFDRRGAVVAYQKLITQLPPLNRQLLLYILDLLAVFASKSDLNRMNSANLAAIFQPGIISHPNHDMAPQEYLLSQDVLIFLIENQDNFLIGMTGTAVDEKTVKDVESGAPPQQSPRLNMGRSASNSSAGADSLRKYGVRRNVSVSSRNSRGSNGAPSPVTPSSGVPFASNSTGSGIGRSNTVPSKRSPAVASARFQRAADSPTPNPGVLAPQYPSPNAAPGGGSSPQLGYSPRSPPYQTQSTVDESKVNTNQALPTDTRGQPGKSDQQSPKVNAMPSPTTHTPSRERKISNLFSRSPSILPTRPADSLGIDQRQPNRLRKKQRIPGSANESAQSSQNSLQGEATQAFHTPLVSPELLSYARPDPMASVNLALINTSATPTMTPTSEFPTEVRHSTPTLPNDSSAQNSALKPPRSPEPSIHSHSSITDQSDFDFLDEPTVRGERAEKRGHKWRFSSSVKRNGDSPLAPPPPLGQNTGARLSNSSLNSSSRPRKSFTGESQLTQPTGTEMSSTGYPSVMPHSSQDSSELPKESVSEPEKKGLFGKWKAKMAQSKEERKERGSDKDRAKSPPGSEAEYRTSKHSLSAKAQEHLTYRGRSMDKPRDEPLSIVNEASKRQSASANQVAPSQGPTQVLTSGHPSPPQAAKPQSQAH